MNFKEKLSKIKLNKKLFLKIYISIIIILAVALIILQILGSKSRVGYLTEFYLLKTNYNENMTNYSYRFMIRYYDKVFRNSDIYGVYPNLSNLPEFVKEIKMDEAGSPFGNLISDRIIEEEKIDNVDYTLKIKSDIIIFIFCILALILFIRYSPKNVLKIKSYIETPIESIFDNNEYFTGKILNIAFYISLFILSIILLSYLFMSPIMTDDWSFSLTVYLYNIYKFSGSFWQRGRHFADILMALPMRPFGNILVSFGAEPFASLKISKAICDLIYCYILTISLSLFVWILNNKRNYKLIFLIVFLYVLLLIPNFLFHTDIAAYIGTGGISILIWLPMLYYFIYNKEFIIGKNKIYYSIYSYLIYFATFTLEPSSMTIAGLSFFIIIYYLSSNKKIFIENNSNKPQKHIFILLILFCILTCISFILTMKSGRAKDHINHINHIGNSPFENVMHAFNQFDVIKNLLIIFAVIYIIFLLFKFIKSKRISKIDYIYFSILFVSILGIIGFNAIRIRSIHLLCLLFSLIFVVFLLQILKNLNGKTISSIISYFIIMGLIVIMAMQVYIDYDNNFKNEFYGSLKSDYKILQIFIEADKSEKSEIILTKEEYENSKLWRQGLINHEPEEWPNYTVSQWMFKYGYTKKLIKIKIID